MTDIQRMFVILFLIFNFFVFLVAFYQCRYKKQAYGRTTALYLLSMYVWGDAFVFGIFFVLMSLVTLLLNDWILFLLIISLFWLVRSVGETIYWFLEQFAVKNRNPIKTLPLQNVFHNDSIWFIFQIFNQCVTVVTIITSVYLFHLWLSAQ